MSSQTTHPEDYSRRWYVLASVAMGIFLGTIDGGIVNIALPTLTREFQATVGGVRWIVLAYMATVAALMLPMGHYGDKLGKKKIYSAGFLIFTIASALCGIAPNLETLVAFRVLQAVGAAMMTSLGMALVTESFPPQQRGKALGITGSIVSLGIIAGPTIGGFIIEHFHWRTIFFVNIPIGIAGSIMAAKFVPDHHHAAKTNSQTYINLLKQPNILFPLAAAFLFFSVTAGLNFLLPFYLDNILKITPSHSGIIMGITPIVLGLFAPMSGILADRIGTQLITTAGSLVAATGFCALFFLTPSTPTPLVIAFLIPPALGLALFQTANNSAILSSVPRHQMGITSSLVGFSRTLGFATGIALFSSLFSAQYDIANTFTTNSQTPADSFSAIHTVFTVIGITSVLAAITGLTNTRIFKRGQAK